MRALVFLLPVVLVACGDGKPTEFEDCADAGELRCGWTCPGGGPIADCGDRKPAALHCHDKTWFVATSDNPCEASCEDVGTNAVKCGGVTLSHEASACDTSATAACGVSSGRILLCKDGAFAPQSLCDDGKHCGMSDDGSAVVCR